MKEQKLQKKIIKFLESLGWYVVKVISANKSGVPDIIACDTKGQFWGIEVKIFPNKPTELQKYNLEKIKKNKGVSLVAYNLEDIEKEIKRRC